MLLVLVVVSVVLVAVYVLRSHVVVGWVHIVVRLESVALMVSVHRWVVTFMTQISLVSNLVMGWLVMRRSRGVVLSLGGLDLFLLFGNGVGSLSVMRNLRSGVIGDMGSRLRSNVGSHMSRSNVGSHMSRNNVGSHMRRSNVRGHFVSDLLMNCCLDLVMGLGALVSSHVVHVRVQRGFLHRHRCFHLVMWVLNVADGRMQLGLGMLHVRLLDVMRFGHQSLVRRWLVLYKWDRRMWGLVMSSNWLVLREFVLHRQLVVDGNAHVRWLLGNLVPQGGLVVHRQGRRLRLRGVVRVSVGHLQGGLMSFCFVHDSCLRDRNSMLSGDRAVLGKNLVCLRKVMDRWLSRSMIGSNSSFLMSLWKMSVFVGRGFVVGLRSHELVVKILGNLDVFNSAVLLDNLSVRIRFGGCLVVRNRLSMEW